jgi:hypothetical protein
VVDRCHRHARFDQFDPPMVNDLVIGRCQAARESTLHWVPPLGCDNSLTPETVPLVELPLPEIRVFPGLHAGAPCVNLYS